jgi:transposase InsO family protein
MQLARALIRRQPYLGAQRLAWDLRNQEGCAISASTMKRLKRRLQEETTPAAATTTNWCFYQRKHPHSLWHGDYLEKVTLHDTDQTAYQLTLQDDYSHAYVFCDLFTAPNVVTTIAALIAAMRAYQTIPRAVVFDNGQNFRGRLLQAFCRHLDIRLIHTSVHHPQTNGKLERAFRDDMREFYRQQPRWVLAPLRRALPKYV